MRKPKKGDASVPRAQIDPVGFELRKMKEEEEDDDDDKRVELRIPVSFSFEDGAGAVQTVAGVASVYSFDPFGILEGGIRFNIHLLNQLRPVPSAWCRLAFSFHFHFPFPFLRFGWVMR